MKKPYTTFRHISSFLMLTTAISLLVGCRAEPVDAASAIAAKAPKAGWDNLKPASYSPGDWPWWCGPAQNNIAEPDQTPPVKWSETENIKWRVDLPGKGHATPCISGDKIFIASASQARNILWLLCYDRKTGRQIWKTKINKGKLAHKMHGDNSNASATPACDGERIFLPYHADGSIKLASVDMSGKVLWIKKIAPYVSVQGFSASPVIYKSAVIVVSDSGKNGSMAAVHRKTGEIIWRALRPGANESYASPVIAKLAGRDQLFLGGPGKTRSYDPNSGELIWECDGPTKYITSTSTYGQDTVFVTGGYPKKALLAIKADGKGNVTASHLKWKSDKKAPYVPTPLYHDGLVYAVNDKGLMRCYDAAEGTVVWEHNFDTLFYSSPVLAGDKLYVFDRRQGLGYVMKAGRTFELIAKNKLAAGCFATPVVSKSRIYLRTLKGLLCIGN